MQTFVARQASGRRCGVLFARSVSSVTPRFGDGKTTVAQFVDNAIAQNQYKDALIAPAENVRFTFAHTRRHIDAYAQGFIDMEAKKGDKFAMMYNNHSIPFIVTLGLINIGVETILASPETISESLETVLRDQQLNAFIFPEQYQRKSQIDAVLSVIPEYAYLPYSVPLQSAKFPSLKYCFHGGLDRAKAIMTLAHVPCVDKVGGSVSRRAAQVNAKDVAVSLVSDEHANTQAKKGTSVSQGALINGVESVAKGLEVQSLERVCLAIPGGEGAALLISMAYYSQGGCVVLPDGPTNISSVSAEHACTTVAIMANDFATVKDSNGFDNAQKVIVVGDSKSLSNELKALESAGKKVFTMASGF